MSSQAQLNANRLNAQKSTGPRSAEGKDNSRFNALKFGISAESMLLPDEDADVLDALRHGYFADCRPAGARQLLLTEVLIRADWMIKRFDRIEAQVVNLLSDSGQPANQAVAMVYAAPTGKNNPLPLLHRRRSAAQRDWFKANKELERLQNSAPREDEPSDAEIAVQVQEMMQKSEAARTAGTPQTQPEIGFVPSNDESASETVVSDPETVSGTADGTIK